MNVDVSIVIVNYNTKDLLLSCLSSLASSHKGKHKWEIIVVDNGSEDKSVDAVKRLFPQVHVYAQKENLGFARANNIGIKEAHGKFVLLLNSDTKVSPDAISEVTDYMIRHPDVGVATCKLVLSDGSIDPACHRGFPTPWAAFSYFSRLEYLFPTLAVFSGYHLWYKGTDTIHEIDSPSGAFYFVRSEVVNQVGLLDEAFFMYGEDIDWSFRIRQKGWKIVFIPTVTVLHLKKQSGRANPDASLRLQTKKHFFDTMQLFYEKHYINKYPWPVRQLVRLGIKLGSML